MSRVLLLHGKDTGVVDKGTIKLYSAEEAKAEGLQGPNGLMTSGSCQSATPHLGTCFSGPMIQLQL